MTDSNFPSPPPSLAQRVSSLEDRLGDLEFAIAALVKGVSALLVPEEVARESRGGSPPEPTMGPP